MRRHIGLALLTAALSVLLTGCLFRSTEDLYALPERFPGYEDLTGKRSEIQAGLEMEYGTTVETAVIYSGDNTSVIQFQDMDGDGSQETAVISFRIPGAERSLRVYFLTTQGDTERYEISAVVEGDGTGINAIDYVELSGSGKKEVVVSWRTIEGVNQLGVYSLDELESNETVPVASQLLMTGYSGYSLLDIDRDTRTELAVIRLDPAGVDSTVEVYGWQNGMLDRLGTARLSAGITALASNGVRINYLTGVIPALYITSTLTDGGQATDIVAMRDGSLVNLTMNQETGVSVETIRGYPPYGCEQRHHPGDAPPPPAAHLRGEPVQRLLAHRLEPVRRGGEGGPSLYHLSQYVRSVVSDHPRGVGGPDHHLPKRQQRHTCGHLLPLERAEEGSHPVFGHLQADRHQQQQSGRQGGALYSGGGRRRHLRGRIF